MQPIDDQAAQVRGKSEKPVFRFFVKGTVHCGAAVRERAKVLGAVDEIREMGLQANSRRGKCGLVLSAVKDREWSWYRIMNVERVKSWKLRCRKRHQWMSVSGRGIDKWTSIHHQLGL